MRTTRAFIVSHSVCSNSRPSMRLLLDMSRGAADSMVAAQWSDRYLGVGSLVCGSDQAWFPLVVGWYYCAEQESATVRRWLVMKRKGDFFSPRSWSICVCPLFYSLNIATFFLKEQKLGVKN